MTVGAVTARTKPRSEFRLEHKRLGVMSKTASNVRLQVRPSVGQVLPPIRYPAAMKDITRGVAGDAVARKAASQAAAKIALRKLAFKLVPTPLSLAEPIISTLALQFYNTHVNPTGFPGFDNIDVAFLPDAQGVYPGISPGDYTVNGFGQVQNNTGTFHLLVDESDGSAIFGWRYWGHYEPGTYAAGKPGTDWETKTYGMELPQTQTRTRHRRLRDLAPRARTEPRGPRNIAISVNTAFRDPIRIEHNAPRVRDRGLKGKTASNFVFEVVRQILNGTTEALDLLSLVADASHYHPDSLIIPKSIKGDFNKKLWWLFIGGGINHVDFTELAISVRENEAEDRVYGLAGRMSKYAAQHLNLHLGPQTGPVI